MCNVHLVGYTSEINVVCSKMYTKWLLNTKCGHNEEFLEVIPSGTYNNHWALRANGISRTGLNKMLHRVWNKQVEYIHIF